MLVRLSGELPKIDPVKQISAVFTSTKYNYKIDEGRKYFLATGVKSPFLENFAIHNQFLKQFCIYPAFFCIQSICTKSWLCRIGLVFLQSKNINILYSSDFIDETTFAKIIFLESETPESIRSIFYPNSV